MSNLKCNDNYISWLTIWSEGKGGMLSSKPASAIVETSKVPKQSYKNKVLRIYAWLNEKLRIYKVSTDERMIIAYQTLTTVHKSNNIFACQ